MSERPGRLPLLVEIRVERICKSGFSVTLCRFLTPHSAAVIVTSDSRRAALRYSTMGEFNVDSKAEY